MNYLKKLFHVFLFFLFWAGIPGFLVWYTGEAGYSMMIVFTWIIGLSVIKYLED